MVAALAFNLFHTQPYLSLAVAARQDAITTAVGSAGKLRIYNGTKPATGGAATTLLALARLWGLSWPRSRLQALAARLGADVPFFVGGENAFVEGIGERLTPITVPRQWLAVVKPAASVATREIFDSPLVVRNTEAVIISGFLADASMVRGFGAGSFGRNDLQPAAMSRCADIGEAARWLEARFGHSRMTGSGSAVFAGAGTGAQPTFPLPDDPAPGTVSRMCRSLERHPLRDFADG